MNRHPFIRFFISSTFVDMDIERNIIRNVLSKLKNEYELIGWQIETIDLRWGISQEASTDNKTMRICLNELRLCQELSPKPNFIILLGERYGWIPLPEVIPYRDMQEIQEIASKEESFLLNKWYRLDENALPTGEYIIERRDLDGIELKEYIEKVEIPLHELFVKYASHLKDESHKIIYERSATEQEIQQGALNVSDAEKHIFAYFRKLSNIPDNKEHIYRSNGPKAQFEKRALDRIRQQLINKLDRNNIYIENNLDYHLYTSPAFIDKFSNEIETHLRKIIQQEIDCNQKDDLEYEISEHIAFARKEAEHFYGREGELQFLRQYIDNRESDVPIWIRAKSGIGKSALMAKIIDEYVDKTNTNVICRFCGTTTYSCNAISFFNLLWEELKTYKSLNITSKNPFKSDKEEKKDFFGHEAPDEKFGYIWRKLQKEEVCILVILDALNQLDISQAQWVSELKWLPSIPLPPNVKIIITTTDEIDYSDTPQHIKIYSLDDMKSEAKGLITHKLSIASRTLTNHQWEVLNQILASAEHTPIYLSLLANELTHIHSYDDINGYSLTFAQLVKQIIERLSLAKNHGPHLVKLALGFIANSRIGINTDTMNKLLATDSNYQKELEQFSYHKWDDISRTNEKSIPPIFWARLYYDLSFFLRTKRNIAGEMITIYHEKFREVILEQILSVEEKTNILQLLHNWYSTHWSQEDKLSLHEIAYIIQLSDHNLKDKAFELLSLMKNIDYITMKCQIFGSSISEDYDWLISISHEASLSKNIIQYIIRLKNEVLSLSSYNKQEMIIRATNLCSDTPLHQLVQKRYNTNGVLKNELNYLSLDNSIIFLTNEFGNLPLMSNDGTRVLSLKKAFRQVWLQDFNKGTLKILYTLDKPLLNHVASADLSVHAILFSASCYVYDTYTLKCIYSTAITAKLQWVSLSSDGKKLAYGGSEFNMTIVHLDTKEELIFDLYPVHASFSPSGTYLWFTTNDKFTRINLDTYISKSSSLYEKVVPFEQLEDFRKDISSVGITIAGCSEKWCIAKCQTYGFILGIEEKLSYNGKMRFSYTYSWMKFSNESSYYIFEGTGKYQQYSLPNLTKEKSNFHLLTEGHTYIIDNISDDFTRALSIRENMIFDFQKQAKCTIQNGFGNCGLNSMTTDASGHIILVSAGKNHTMDNDNALQLTRILTDKYEEQVFQVGVTKDTQYIAGSSISPDGTTYAYSPYCYDSTGKIIIGNIHRSTPFLTMETHDPCTAVQFTTDSRFVVMCTGHYIAEIPALIYVLTKEGHFLHNVFLSEEDSSNYAISQKITITPDNRYVLLGEFEYKILDLITNQEINSEGIPINTYTLDIDTLNSDRIPLLAIHPDSKQIFTSNEGKLYRFNIKERKLYIREYQKEIMGISPNGKYLLTRNTTRQLYCYNWKTQEEKYLMDNVELIFPTFDERNLFVLRKNWEIIFCNYEGNILQRAYCEPSARFVVNAKGLAVGQTNGRVALFVPDAKYEINHPAITALNRRWNLKTGKRGCFPEVVCPLCGHSFTPPFFAIIKMKQKCPKCNGQLKFNTYK